MSSTVKMKKRRINSVIEPPPGFDIEPKLANMIKHSPKIKAYTPFNVSPVQDILNNTEKFAVSTIKTVKQSSP
jgi:hypothetical protein